MFRKSASRRAFLSAAGVGSLTALSGCSTLSSGDDTTTRNPVIEAPATRERDEVTEITIRNVEPGSEVTLTARIESEDDDGTVWQSENVFEATDDGTVDLTTQAPVEGSYDRVDGMGWLWSMTPQSEDQALSTEDDTFDVTLEASGKQTVQKTITRQEAPTDLTTEQVDTDELVGVYAEPMSSGPHPGVLALHGSGGASLGFHAKMFASHGFAVFAPQYFGDHDSIPDQLSRVPLEYFDRANYWLRQRDAVRDEPVSLYGVSRGGELALLLGATYDWPGVVVSNVGSGVVFNGNTRNQSAWEIDGEPVPWLQALQSDYELTNQGHYRGRPAFHSAYDDADADELDAATIPVENIDGPVLLISGEDDQLWPSNVLSNHAYQRLEAKDFAHDVSHESYANAGHTIIVPYEPTHGTRVGEFGGSTFLFGGTPAGNAAAAADSWPRILEFLGAEQ